MNELLLALVADLSVIPANIEIAATGAAELSINTMMIIKSLIIDLFMSIGA